MEEVRKVLEDGERRMKKSIETLKSELAKLRAGRASPSILDPVKVDYYGTQVPLRQIASILAPEPRLLVVQPWDKNALPEIEKAIRASGLGLNPKTEKGIIKIPIPPLSEERRQELSKLVKKMLEDIKIAIRNIRRDMMEKVKKFEKDKIISEDDRIRYEKEIQKVTDKHIEEAEKIADEKIKEIMEG